MAQQIQQYAPVNYMALAPEMDVGRSIQEGLQLGATVGEVFAKKDSRKLAEETRAQYATDLQATLANPTADKFAQLTLKYPQQREAFKQSWDTLDKVQQDNEFLVGAQAFNAINAGKIDVAKKLIDDQITAAANSGKPTVKFEAMRKTLEENPKLVQGQLGLILSTVNPDKWSKIATESRAAEVAPFDLTKKRADAIVADAQARFTPAKLAADLQVSQEQAKQLKAGMMPLEKRPEAEAKFRKEYSDQTKAYQDVKAAYGRIQSTDKSGAGDIALIFNYMKMLDPGSVVREGEFATAETAGGAFAKVGNLYNKLLTGERLKDEQRNMFVKQSERLYQSAAGQEKVVRSGIERIATGYGLKPENIFYEAVETAPTAPGSTVSVGGKTYNRPANFTDAQWNAYKQSVGAK